MVFKDLKNEDGNIYDYLVAELIKELYEDPKSELYKDCRNVWNKYKAKDPPKLSDQDWEDFFYWLDSERSKCDNYE